MIYRPIILASFLVCAACVDSGQREEPVVTLGAEERIEKGTALTDARGAVRATARLERQGDGVAVSIEGQGLSPGAYGAHIHAVGRCDGPDFTSAGPHWNPDGRQHGRENPAGAHRGDLPNLIVGGDGRGSLTFTIPGATLDAGEGGLFDADGSAILLHAAPDDYRTDPSGNSGARIACGVIGEPR